MRQPICASFSLYAMAVLLVALRVSGCATDSGNDNGGEALSAGTGAVTAALTPVTTGLSAPVFITHAGDTRLFIVEQPGRIRILHQGVLNPVPFLDITPLVRFGGEQGFFSVAFHPEYDVTGAAGAGLFWVNYTDVNGDTVIARYSVSRTNPDVADASSVDIVLTIPQPFSNHNGGQLQFGPVEGVEMKSYLYIGMGDGGSGGDPQNNGQSDTTLLGKMLRIDPSLAANPSPPFYTIPPDNPSAAADIPLGAIWAKGLRNPWRFSFDALTGVLYIADVGQNRWEEINVTPAASPGGWNYGWRIMEARHCFNPPNACDMRGLVLPVFEYALGGSPFRCAIIGGYVYRGASLPALQGVYVYADWCSGEIFGLTQTTSGTWTNTLLHTSAFRPLGFGEGVDHELYIGGDNGTVYQVTTARTTPRQP